MRNLARHKIYTFINIIGLAIGLVCSTVILFYLQHELSFDRHHSKAERIHWVFTADRQVNDNLSYYSGTPRPVGPALAAEYPEVERATRFLFRPPRVLVEGKDL